MVWDKEVTLLKQLGHPLLNALGAAVLATGDWRRPRTAAGQFRGLRRQFLAEAGDRVQDRLGQFLEDVELANLMADVP